MTDEFSGTWAFPSSKDHKFAPEQNRAKPIQISELRCLCSDMMTRSPLLSIGACWLISACATWVLLPEAAPAAEGTSQGGYYRFPAIHGETLVFTAEGDLWKGSIRGGVAQRLTSHPSQEVHPAISPDGRTLAFSAQYEGAQEVYSMPVEGGRPTRHTFEGYARVEAWTPDGKILYSSWRRSSLPDEQTLTLDLVSGESALLPLARASGGVFDPSGRTFFFTPLTPQFGAVKRYRGGTAQNLWKFTAGEPEAVPLTKDFPGISREPMWWEGRVYFVSDRDGTLNLWSMMPDGSGLKQHTAHKGWDVRSPSLSQGRIVYQLGADLRLHTLATGTDEVVPLTLASDFDHQREKWVKKPMDYVTAANLSPNGDRVVITARGQIFVAPVGPGRLIEVTRKPSIRYRFAQFMPDGKSLLALSDETGEVEFERLPANGIGQPERLTSDGKILRWGGQPSPDGKWLAHHDKDQRLWLLDLERKQSKQIATSPYFDFSGLAWSPDSQWLSYVVAATNHYQQIWLYQVADGRKLPLTSERVNSYNPAWSPDGKWLYFLSERHLESLVASPWGHRQPEPFFDRLMKIYAVSLARGGRSPFEPPDELHPKEPKSADPEPAKDNAAAGAAKPGATNQAVNVVVDLDGLASRIWEVPVPPGNYQSLSVNDKRLFWVTQETSADRKQHLMMTEIANEEAKPKTLVEDIKSYQLSRDGKKLFVHKGDAFHVEDATAAAPAKLEKSINLKDWTFSLNPRDEWRQMFVEAWRLERDYFYDRQMHGVDWPGMLKKYSPLLDRVTDRAELSDLVYQMVGELAALHIFVHSGDHREGPDQIKTAGLGAEFVRDAARGGWRVERVYRADPDYPNKLSPLARPGVEMKAGDIIELINGTPTLSTPHPWALLRNQAGKQVLLRVTSPGAEKPREVVVKPMNDEEESDLRYGDWELSRRERVEAAGRGELGYVHLRAMGKDDIAQWARDYYPVFNRKGLIIDVRHNRGGNIDSWILEKLLRKAWFYWQHRVGPSEWNMQHAFRGHLVVLCDENTGSDGEAFTEGFRRLGLGKVIGTRTWGGGIWLTGSNWLVDRGIATAAEFGTYGPEGRWLVEGHGVDPDIVVENPPHATFKGEDAQLAKAIEYLQEEIRRKPVEVPPVPPYPDKSLK